MPDFLAIAEYPQAIKELSEAASANRHRLKQNEADIEHRKAWLRLYGGVTGSNDKTRDADHALKCREDVQLRTLLMKNEELVINKDRYETDIEALRMQFSVLKLQAQERIAFARSTDPNAGLLINALDNVKPA